MCPHSDLGVDVARSIVNHFLGFDLLSLSTSQKDAFCATLAVLESASKVPQFNVFISKALTQTYFIFLTLDIALKSNMEISSKLNGLKGQKIEFEEAQLC